MRNWFKKFLSNDNKSGESFRTLIIALFVVLLIRSSIAAPYKIPTGSMIPTLQIGDHIFVSKLSYGLKLPFTNINMIAWDQPKRGDVIVFKYPEDPSKDFIKRVVGIPGDTIEVRAGQLFLNDTAVPREVLSRDKLTEEVEESRGHPDGYSLYQEKLGNVEHRILHNSDYFYSALSDRPPLIVKEENYFVMGDNRDNSKDSREWGFVPFKAIRGRALVVFFSLKKSPWWGIRWNRFGRVIR